MKDDKEFYHERKVTKIDEGKLRARIEPLIEKINSDFSFHLFTRFCQSYDSFLFPRINHLEWNIFIEPRKWHPRVTFEIMSLELTPERTKEEIRRFLNLDSKVFCYQERWKAIYKEPKCIFLRCQIPNENFEEIYENIEKMTLEKIKENNPLLKALSDNNLSFRGFYFSANRKFYLYPWLSLLDIDFKKKIKKIIESNKKMKDIFSRFFLKQKIMGKEFDGIDFINPFKFESLQSHNILFIPNFICDDLDLTRIRDIERFKELIFKHLEKDFFEWVCFYKIKKDPL